MQPALGLLVYAEHPLKKIAEITRVAEDSGYRYLWYADVRLAREIWLGLSVMAAHSSRILVGPGVTDPYTRHPAVTAAAIATFDELTGGRAVLGLGVGGNSMKELGIEQKLPVAALRETVEIVRALLSGKRITRAGKVITINDGQLTFTPMRSTMPIYFATHGMQVANLAGQIADGVQVANTLAPAAFDKYLAQIDGGIAKAGRTPDAVDIGIKLEACISDDDEAALRVMQKRIATRVAKQYPHWGYMEETGVKVPQAYVDIVASGRTKLTDEEAKLFPIEVVETMAVGGNWERVAARLAAVLSPRVTHITLQPQVVPGQDVNDVVTAFARKVMSRVGSLRAEAAKLRA
ncbi:MAG: LLM class flavin-dependent oxidoreductase [Alphaproteobacteria bacterium]|nr:LLM class flavin-dependent oxidoreductase [Alphaproteobacteria bacterium]